MSKMISEAAGQFRMVAGPDEFFDILDKIKPGQFMTFGYVTAAKLDYPKKKILNPATKRMNTVDDYQTFGQNLGVQDNVTGVVKVCIYNMQWQDKKKFSQRYNDFKTTRDSLYDKYGLTRNSARYQTQNNNYGGGVKQYAGDNDDLKLHTYTDANLYDVKYSFHLEQNNPNALLISGAFFSRRKIRLETDDDFKVKKVSADGDDF